MSRSLSHPEDFLILCVEDEPSLLKNIVEELLDFGFRAIGAEDGQVALDVLAGQRPDLILCDITMPRMGGFELLRSVRNARSDIANIPFVFLTALSDRLAVIEGKMAGADDYLSKPIDFDLMLVTVRARLDQVVRIHEEIGATAERRLQTETDIAARQGLDDMAQTLDHVALGVVLFDDRREIVHKNLQADAVLGTLITHANGRLSATDAQLSGKLRAGLDAAIEGSKSSDLIAVAEEGQHPLLVQFIALGGPKTRAAMLLLDTSAPPVISEEQTGKLFALTPTEARVAAAIARGMRTEEIALDMGISATTLAFHMRNIFRKAGVRRQQDLVGLIFRSALLGKTSPQGADKPSI
ncbi:response regulator [Devosia riboflavina]